MQLYSIPIEQFSGMLPKTPVSIAANGTQVFAAPVSVNVPFFHIRVPLWKVILVIILVLVAILIIHSIVKRNKERKAADQAIFDVQMNVTHPS